MDELQLIDDFSFHSKNFKIEDYRWIEYKDLCITYEQNVSNSIDFMLEEKSQKLYIKINTYDVIQLFVCLFKYYYKIHNGYNLINLFQKDIKGVQDFLKI
ncbi:MAG: hypothetical protein RR630_09275 [Coprobacillus sp.]